MRRAWHCASISSSSTLLYICVSAKRGWKDCCWGWWIVGLFWSYVPFVFKLVPQLEDLDLDRPLAVVLEDAAVGLALPVAQAVEVLGVGRGAVARPEVREVALDVARGARAAWGGEADVVGHCVVVVVELSGS